MTRVAVASDPRAVAAHVWRSRRRAELQAGARFARIAVELERFDAHRDVVSLASDAAHEEGRHAELCAELVSHFGGAVHDDAPVPAVLPVAPPNLKARDALLYEIVALSCVTETLSTALLGALVACARDGAAKEAMHEILRDEVRHSRLGWAHLASEHARGCRDVVGAHLPALLSATVSEHLFDGAPGHAAQAELTGLGSLPKQERAEIVGQTLTDIVFPGLARFGIDITGGTRWLATRQRPLAG